MICDTWAIGAIVGIGICLYLFGVMVGMMGRKK